VQRFVRTLFVLSVAAFGVFAPSANAAQASVGCWGDYCSGRDPMQTGCGNDAYTVAAHNEQYASLQIRWSPTCKTNWARLVVYPTGRHTFIYGSLFAHQDTGYEQSTTTPFSNGGTYWTPMIYSPTHCVKAIFYPQFHTYEKVETICV